MFRIFEIFNNFLAVNGMQLVPDLRWLQRLDSNVTFVMLISFNVVSHLYCEIFGTRSYCGDALLRHMNSCWIFHNIHSITYKHHSTHTYIIPWYVAKHVRGCQVCKCLSLRLRSKVNWLQNIISFTKDIESIYFINIIMKRFCQYYTKILHVQL